MYYKVTRHDQRSVILSLHGVQYFTDSWVQGKIEKLFIFARLQDALRFCTNRSTGELYYPIWKCEVRNPEPLCYAACGEFDYERFWESFPHIPEMPTMSLISGTIVADAVKLLEQVC